MLFYHAYVLTTVVSEFSSRYDFDINTSLLSHYSEKKVYLGILSSHCRGGYRVGVTPGPISNPEAKPYFADNTASFRCGNVGRCRP